MLMNPVSFAQGVQKHTAADLTNVATVLHGPGGLFSTPGLENPLMSLVIPPMGLGAYLPAFPRTEVNPRYGFLYAITDSGDDEPDEICEDAPTADLSTATLSTEFGHVQRATKTIELAHTAFTINSADRTDLQLLATPQNPLNPDGNGVFFPNGVSTGDMLNNLFRAQMVAASFIMQAKMVDLTWTGDPADATSGGGYIPFTGLLNLVKTGYQDVITTSAIPKADSVVISAGHEDLVSSSSFSIVAKLRQLVTYLDSKATSLFGAPATYAICMRPELWSVLSDLWPIAYPSEFQDWQSNTAGQATININFDANSLTTMRDNLKASQTLVINGRAHQVVVDHGLPLNDTAADASVPAGSYGSHIVLIPLSAGGMPLTYWEYLDWRVAMAYLSAIQAEGLSFWTDGGRFLWTADQAKTCVKFQVRTRPRIVLRAPHLAGRIDDITWEQGDLSLPLPG